MFAETATPDAGKTTFAFQAMVKQLLRLTIHSLYSHKEIFPLELVSNASDACDKSRFESLSNPNLLGSRSGFTITIDTDSGARAVTITDTGNGGVDNFGKTEL